MRYLAICASVILLSTTTCIPVAQSQTRKSIPRSRRTRTVKPVKPAPKSSAVITTPSGLIYVITRRSEGRTPRPGETVVVNYTGLLTSGVKFDSSLDRGQPFKFKLGEGRVIKGWDEGIEKLRVGEQATLIIPSELGYGATGSGGIIPPGATLIFIVELMGIEEPPGQ
jgi:FKBP-type peptidyl-prolyl cis-trans isomerase